MMINVHNVMMCAQLDIFGIKIKDVSTIEKLATKCENLEDIICGGSGLEKKQLQGLANKLDSKRSSSCGTGKCKTGKNHCAMLEF